MVLHKCIFHCFFFSIVFGRSFFLFFYVIEVVFVPPFSISVKILAAGNEYDEEDKPSYFTEPAYGPVQPSGLLRNGKER